MAVARPLEAPVWKKMGLLFLMFVLQNISLGFTWTLLPIMMRKQGLSLGMIGLSALLYSPWALKFLWASKVDRHYSPRWGRRKSWITPLSLLTLVLLPVLACLDPHQQLPLVLGVVFLLNINIATTDIAVDGYATDMLRPRERSWGNTTQMTGYIIGHMLGSGLFLISYECLGWAHTLWIMTGLYLLLTVPVLAHGELAPMDSPAPGHAGTPFKPSARAFLRLTRIRWFLLFLLLAGSAENGGTQLRLTMLADLGLNPQVLGELLLWIGSPLSILGSIAGGFLLNRLGALRVFVLCCVMTVALSWFSALLPGGVCDTRWGAGIMLGGERLISGAMMVLIYSIIMGLSAGRQAATNYAVLCSLNHVVSLGILPVTGVIGDYTGYSGFFTGLGCFGILTLFAGSHILRHRLDAKNDATS
ncbi:MAG: MFS transporter [Desulfarculaceae bacterium]|jgi:MFS family permease